MKVILGATVMTLSAITSLIFSLRGAANAGRETFIYDDHLRSASHIKNIKSSTYETGRHLSSTSSHMGSAYANTFATFTTEYKLISDGTTWAGRWKDTSLMMSNLLTRLDTREGPSSAKFSFVRGINKSWFNLTLGDGTFFDSNSLLLAINLKMSTFDPITSTFSIDCSQWEEHFASGLLIENYFNLEPLNYFDMSFRLKATSKKTGQPISLDTTDLDDVTFEFSIRSSGLGIKMEGNLEHSIPTVTSNWVGFFILLIFYFLFFFDLIAVTSLVNNNQFVGNIGFEVFSIQLLYFYHLFCISMHLIRINPDHTLFLIFFGIVTFFMCFMFQIVAISCLTVDGQLRRGRPHQGAADVYRCLFFFFVLVIIIILAFLTRTLMMWKYHKYFLLGFFIYPIIQIPCTLVRASGRNIFDVRYQLICYMIPLVYLFFFRASINPFINLKPWGLILPIAGGSCLFGAGFMALQNCFGVYFFVPSFLKQTQQSYLISVSKVPKEVLKDVCSICYGVLKYDPVEGADVEMGSQEGDSDRSSVEGQSLRTKVKELMKLNCNHYFHPGCLTAWFATKQACPLCNAQVEYYDY